MFADIRDSKDSYNTKYTWYILYISYSYKSIVMKVIICKPRQYKIFHAFVLNYHDKITFVLPGPLSD